MKRYEGLFVLNTAGKEESIKDIIDKITNEITQAGGKVETVQKMEKKPFSRTPDRKVTSGFYVNFLFEGAPAIIAQLRRRFVNDEDIFRVLFTLAAAPKEETAKLAKA